MLRGANRLPSAQFCAEVTAAYGGGPGRVAEEGELTEVTHLPVRGAQIFAEDRQVPKTFSVIFGISWLLSHVAPEVYTQINPRLFNSEAQ